MITSCLKCLMIVGLTAGFAGTTQAEDFDIGKSEFQSSCASCHGAERAKGLSASSSRCRLPI
jgi:mono/diheme cytochrome c family protein